MAIELNGPLVLVGAGNMGGALLAGWLAQGLSADRIVVQDPSPPPSMMALARQHGFTVTDRAAPSTAPSVVMLAVKPQIMTDVVAGLVPIIGPGTVVLSIAAGRTIASFEAALPAGRAVVRSMPNTPASVGRGITAAIGNAHVTSAQRSVCDALLRSIGEVVWLDHEAQIDAVTAVSGSGPAYVFLLAECLAEAGRKAGLSSDLAAKLARWTVAGAGELLHRADVDAAQLRRNVTSPNGTTHAALQVLMAEPGLQDLMDRAVAAAARRSEELSK